MSSSIFSGVPNCYVFKSRLQEYAQKEGLSTPVYETVKEGPSHEPTFRSSVVVNNVRYDSLPGFFNRKAAEQSAAEVAFMEILNSGKMSEYTPNPVHETGLCKNLLQEYAQKMNFAIPSYIVTKQEIPSQPPFCCTVEIGGTKYIGAAARNKKDAEIKAARTALLAIQSKTGGRRDEADLEIDSIYSVVPFKKKAKEPGARNKSAKPLKPKKAGFKMKPRRHHRQKRRVRGDKSEKNTHEGTAQVGSNDSVGVSEANSTSQNAQELASVTGLSLPVMEMTPVSVMNGYVQQKQERDLSLPNQDNVFSEDPVGGKSDDRAEDLTLNDLLTTNKNVNIPTTTEGECRVFTESSFTFGGSCEVMGFSQVKEQENLLLDSEFSKLESKQLLVPQLMPMQML